MISRTLVALYLAIPFVCSLFLHESRAEPRQLDLSIELQMLRILNRNATQCPIDDFRFDVRTKIDKKSYCSPFSAKRACDAARTYCQSEYGQSYCVAFGTAEAAKRLGSTPFLEKTATEANKIFRQMVSDPDVQIKCCGYDSECWKKFSKTGFAILTGAGAKDSTYQYREENVYSKRERRQSPETAPPLHQIILSEAMLANFYTVAGLKRAILHELGHACQHSRHYQKLSGAMSYYFSEDCDSDGNYLSDIEARYSPEIRKCVAEALRSEKQKFDRQNPAIDKQACWNAWVEEAFADLVFLDELGDATALAWNCSGVIDRHHGPYEPVLACLEKDQKFVKSWCD